MDLKKFRQIIQEEVRKAIQEELKDILAEAVIIASTPKHEPKPHTKTTPQSKSNLSEIINKPHQSTGNPIMDLLNETANEGEWRSLNGGYKASDAVGWGGGAPNMGGANTPVVSTVSQMLSQQPQVRDINDVRIDAVPDFTGLMGKLKNR